MLAKYGNSPQRLLKVVYSDSEWLPWRFSKVPIDFYRNPENIRSMLDWLKVKSGVTEDKNLRMEDFRRFGLERVLEHFSASPSLVVEAAGRESEKERRPIGYWKDINNQRAFMEEARKNLNIKQGDFEPWYAISAKTIERLGGRALLSAYKTSMFSLLFSIYPEYDWLPWKFTNLVKKSWKDPTVVVKAVAFAEQALSLKNKTDWYKVTKKQVSALGMRTLFQMNGGIEGAVKMAYPDVEWQSWRFPKLGQASKKGGSASVEELQDALAAAEISLNIKEDSDWYRVSLESIKTIGLKNLLSRNGGLAEILKKTRPEVTWDSALLASGKR